MNAAGLGQIMEIGLKNYKRKIQMEIIHSTTMHRKGFKMDVGPIIKSSSILKVFPVKIIMASKMHQLS